jgi:hypothetical protein
MSAQPHAAEPQSLDRIYDLLKNERRRVVLDYLRDHETPASLGSVTDYVASVQNGVDVDEVSTQERKRVYVSLFQTHLPKMADQAALRFDNDEGTVACAERTELFIQYLDLYQESNVDISPGTLFNTLKRRRCRLVIQYLSDDGGPVGLTDLSVFVAARKFDVAESDVTDQQKKRVYISLYQTHLPKLDDVGLVNFNATADRMIVELAASNDTVLRFAGVAPDPTVFERFVRTVRSIFD